MMARALSAAAGIASSQANACGPTLSASPARSSVSAEAVDDNGRAIKLNDKPLNWGGVRMLCTRESKFEIRDHNDCNTRGLTSAGFAIVDMSGGGRTLRFATP